MKHLKTAVIDCGTNTFNLLIIEEHEGIGVPLFTSKLPVKIGEGGFQEQLIQSRRMVRAIDALLCHKANCINFECDQIFAFATSAVRDAHNRMDFIHLAKSVCGLEIQILSGEEEATYIARGVRKSISPNTGKSLIMDIGGGSVEFIITEGEIDLWKASYNLGVSRMHDVFFKTDISYSKSLQHSTNYDSFKEHLSSALIPLIEAVSLHQPTVLIGSSGSFDTLLDMYRNKTSLEMKAEGLCSEIPLTAFRNMHQWMLKSSMEDRYAHAHIPAIRAEYMPIATALIEFVLQESGIQRLIHSPFSLKEGLIDAWLSGEINRSNG